MLYDQASCGRSLTDSFATRHQLCLPRPGLNLHASIYILWKSTRLTAPSPPSSTKYHQVDSNAIDDLAFSLVQGPVAPPPPCCWHYSASIEDTQRYRTIDPVCTYYGEIGTGPTVAPVKVYTKEETPRSDLNRYFDARLGAHFMSNSNQNEDD